MDSKPMEWVAAVVWLALLGWAGYLLAWSFGLV